MKRRSLRRAGAAALIGAGLLAAFAGCGAIAGLTGEYYEGAGGGLSGGLDACITDAECAPGDDRACGNCGKRTCREDCTWGPCSGEGPCSPGDTDDCPSG